MNIHVSKRGVGDDELQELIEHVDMEDYLAVEGINYKITPGTSGVQLNLKECPRCGGSSWKVYLNMDTGLGNCFHGSCAGESGFNKFTYIRHHLGFPPARDVIKHIKTYALESGWRPKRKKAVTVNNDVDITLPQSMELPIKGKFNLQYLADRGFDITLSKFFGWRYCHVGNFPYKDLEGKDLTQDYSRRVIIPVYDLEGNLRTFQGRDITGESERRYLFPPGLAGTGRYIYNAHNCIGLEHIVLGEGAFDVAATKQALDTRIEYRQIGCAGTFGKHLSNMDGVSQLSTLQTMKALGLKTVTFMWDGDNSSIDHACEAALLVRSVGLKARVAMLPIDKDPNECSVPEVISAFEKAAVITRASIVSVRMKVMTRKNL